LCLAVCIFVDSNLFYIWCRWNDIDLRLDSHHSRVVELFVWLSSLLAFVSIAPCFVRRPNPKKSLQTFWLVCQIFERAPGKDWFPPPPQLSWTGHR
jgi:hypothetical protein